MRVESWGFYEWLFSREAKPCLPSSKPGGQSFECGSPARFLLVRAKAFVSLLEEKNLRRRWRFFCFAMQGTPSENAVSDECTISIAEFDFFGWINTSSGALERVGSVAE